MSERAVREFLAATRRLVGQMGLYPPGHPLNQEVLTLAVAASDPLMNAEGEAVLTLLDDAIYFGPQLLAHASLEFNGLLREMQERGIESVTLIDPVDPADLLDLASFVAAQSDDIPAAGTVRLNERPLSRSDLETSEMSALRSSYAASLDALRSIGFAMKGAATFEMGGATAAVQNLVEQTVGQPGASLLLATVKGHDEYTYFHSVNTSIYALALGRLIGVDEAALINLGMGALLHDIGKIGVSSSVLQHPGRLSHEQWEEIRFHPQNGAEAILTAASSGQEVAAVVALEHHARYDGAGYPKLVDCHPHPNGEGHDHPHDHLPHLFSRIVSVADTYDAITTRRSYRRAETPNRALRVVLMGAGTSYDPELVPAFIRLMGAYPVGSILRLRSAELVMVTQIAERGAGHATGVVVKGTDGVAVTDPEPRRFAVDDVVEQLLPDRAGVDPAALLESAGVRQGLAAA